MGWIYSVMEGVWWRPKDRFEVRIRGAADHVTLTFPASLTDQQWLAVNEHMDDEFPFLLHAEDDKHEIRIPATIFPVNACTRVAAAVDRAVPV